VIVDKGGRSKSLRYRKGERKQIVRGEKAKDMILERDQLKLSTQVGRASS
jgi:hypothetical protein